MLKTNMRYQPKVKNVSFQASWKPSIITTKLTSNKEKILRGEES